MVITPLDEPEDLIDYPCKICGGKMPRVKHYFVNDKWLHPTCHPRCIDQWDRQHYGRKPKEHHVPERFAQFDASRANAEAVRLCGTFSPESSVKTLAILGVAARGKSRLLWATVKGFFDELGYGWVDAFMFETLMAEYDKAALMKIVTSRYVLIDDVGAIDCYGREKAGLQAALRSRIKANEKWTFLTIDKLDNFDPDLEHILSQRALNVIIE